MLIHYQRRISARVAGWMAMPILLIGIAHPLQARWYQVEIIVFSQEGSAAEEPSVADEPSSVPVLRMPSFQDTVVLRDGAQDSSDAGAAAAAEEESPQRGLVSFVELSPAERTLSAVHQRLAGDPRYRPIAYRAWRQPSFGLSAARKVRILDEQSAEEIVDQPRSSEITIGQDSSMFADGFIRLRIGQLLNVDLDLYYFDGSITHRLSESRRVRFDELHYFDHPNLGALVAVRPINLATTDDKSTLTEEEAASEAGVEN